MLEEKFYKMREKSPNREEESKFEKNILFSEECHSYKHEFNKQPAGGVQKSPKLARFPPPVKMFPSLNILEEN